MISNSQRMEKLCDEMLGIHLCSDQIKKTAEECIELANECLHFNRDPESTANIAREMADVKIMICQLEICLGRAFCSKYETEKLNKLEGILNDLHNSPELSTGESLCS